jgi:hypothetical protein
MCVCACVCTVCTVCISYRCKPIEGLIDGGVRRGERCTNREQKKKKQKTDTDKKKHSPQSSYKCTHNSVYILSRTHAVCQCTVCVFDNKLTDDATPLTMSSRGICVVVRGGNAGTSGFFLSDRFLLISIITIIIIYGSRM